MYYDSRIANCSVDQARVVWWPELEPLWSNGPRHIGYRRKALVIVRTINHIILRLKRRNIREREDRLSTLYLELLIILDFWLF